MNSQVWTYVIILILVICVIYLLIPKDSRCRKRYKEMYKKSNGTFDDAAKQTLKEIKNIKNPKIDEEFITGDIIRFNILEENLVENPRLTIEAFNRYGNTLHRILNNEEPEHVDETQPDRQFMVDRIADFGDRMLEDNIMDVIELPIEAFNVMLVGSKVKVKAEDISDRKYNAYKEAKNKKEYAEKFLDKSIKYTSDGQNVHDSLVGKDLRETLAELNTTLDPSTTRDDIEREIIDFAVNEYSEKDNEQKVNIVIEALNTIKNNSYISTLKSNEGDIVKAVWDRSKYPQNSVNQNKMKEAMIDSIVDCWENGSLVCINGRCGRYISSISTLDYDNKAGKVGTKETYRNEILDNTRKILEKEIENARKSPDKKLNDLGKSYTDTSISIDHETENKFISEVKESIDTMVNTYKTKIEANDLERIRKEAHAAIE